MHLYDMPIKGLVIRLFIFMLVTIGGAFIGLPWWLIIVAGMLVFLSGYFGITAEEIEESIPRKDEKK